MRVLIACEFSGIVREAFIERGHNAMSVDLLDSEQSGPNHIVGDILDFLSRTQVKWDLMIAFPPCTHLAVSGARWFSGKQIEQRKARGFFLDLIHANVPRVAIENPIGIMSTQYRKPDQIIHPWQFGHGETKATCLWLKELPRLVPTNVVEGRHARVHREPPSPDRWKNRSRTYTGIAKAMAEQWGGL
jgi:hypothetical protein